MTESFVVVDEPRSHVRRITLNRPEKRNAMSNKLRGELFDELRRGDQDFDVSVMIIRGAGPAFCAGYDLKQDPSEPQPRPLALRDGYWSRGLVEG
jgi:enoyl-CoA hydratase/carnithine racemase